MTGINILIVTDAWKPQTNGVVTTLTNVVSKLRESGHTVRVIEPSLHRKSYRTPYPDVRVGFACKGTVKKWIMEADAIHISTPEGPLGMQSRYWCKRLGREYTTSYHTKWPEFLSDMYWWGSKALGRFLVKMWHRDSRTVLVPTEEVKRELKRDGIKNVEVWSRGVNRDQFSFNPEPEDYLVCVSRVSREKNLEAFFAMDVKKIMVGDGPVLEEYRDKYPDVEFVGNKSGKELTSYYQNAKCFVFPSRNDTFGLVMIEAMSCGTPVAAYPVTGPINVVDEGETGYLDVDLSRAVQKCLTLDRNLVRERSKKWSWDSSTEQLLSYLYVV